MYIATMVLDCCCGQGPVVVIMLMVMAVCDLLCFPFCSCSHLPVLTLESPKLVFVNEFHSTYKHDFMQGIEFYIGFQPPLVDNTFYC